MNSRTPNRSRIVSAWRRHLGLSVRQMAAQQHTSPSMLANWEQGIRGSKVGRDEFLQATAGLRLSDAERVAFADMWTAAPIAVAQQPRGEWRANLDFDGGPVWAWVVAADRGRQATAAIWWGETLAPIDYDDAVIVQFAASIPNPPVDITLSSPAWVIFGRGHIPEGVARALKSDRVLGRLPSREDVPFSPWQTGLAGMQESLNERRKGTVERAVSGTAPWVTAGAAEPVTDSSGNLISQLLVSAEQARTRRVAAGLSRQQTAVQATSLDIECPVTAGAIRGLEEGRSVTTPGLLWRLDLIYGADGRLGIDRTSMSDAQVQRGMRLGAPLELAFPREWVGPVWVQFRGRVTDEPGPVTLRWGNWKREQRVPARFTLTTRKAFRDREPLFVSAPTDWHVIAGIGLPPAATDVNKGWEPVDQLAADVLVAASQHHTAAPQRAPETRAEAND